MKPIHTLRLQRALPLLVIGAFGLLLAFSLWYQHSQMLRSIEARAQNDVRQMLADSEIRIESLIRHEEKDMLAVEMAMFGVNSAINNAALIDDGGSVMLATRLEWLGRDFRQVLPDFASSACASIRLKQNAIIEYTADRQRLLGCQPVMLALEAGKIRPTRIGLLLLDYDLSRFKTDSWHALLKSMLPVLIIGALLMVAVGAIISFWIDRPLRYLTDVVARFKEGDYLASAHMSGKGELATLGEAWNRMRERLQETIAQLEESKERLAVTLFSIGDAVIATDTDNHVTFMNDVAQQLTGWSLSDALGKELEEVFVIINALTRKCAEAPAKRVLATGQTVGLANHTVLISRDKAEYQIADSAAPIRARDGAILGVVLVFRDVTEEYHLRESLSYERSLLRCIIDAVPDLIFFKDRNGVYLGCNQAFAEFAGRAESQQIGKTDFDFFEHETAEFFRQKDMEMFETGESCGNEEWVKYPDGRRRLLDTIKTPFYAPDGQLLGVVGISRDITERKRFEEQLLASEERIRSLGNNLPDGYIYQYALDSDGKPCFQFVSKGVEKIHGVGVEQVLSDPATLFGQVDPAQIAQYREAEKRSRRELSDFSMELRLKYPEGGERWLSLCSRPKLMGDSPVWDGVAIDITEKKRSEEQIWRQANFDPLTGLPNRQMFHDRLDQEIRKCSRNGASFALLFIDLDHFKEINDTLGHALGDELLQIAARRLRGCVRDTDTVSRLGGDEFTIIMTGIESADAVERVAQAVLSCMMEPFPLNGESSYVSASVGITLYPTDAMDAAQLIQNADQAMYAAKSNGRNGYSYFTVELQYAAQYRMNMINDLRNALSLQQFEMYYQPIVELKNGGIHKAEALIRWRHPSKGLVSPGLFISVAEENGLIVRIGDWAFRQVVSQVRIFRQALAADFQVSINKSPMQFRQNNGSESDWLECLRQMGLPGDSVVIEITEGLLLDVSPNTSRQLLNYRDAGVQVSLDDFGTGYSSLAYIQKFDIDYLKIDQRFIANLSTNSTNMALCEAIILMAHKLGIKVIAEGIETEAQHALLREMGCDYGQGYLFSRPMPADDFVAMLAAR
ncbi:EAL domain-containing protein [Methylomonas rapida]|uniref:EAL domain-containing protein n=1 Tax=Methylomonas rapida TaxID=2963939 RepID=A0ABY7GFC6_9GAMM|nr:EAL domain-containing protein [Methylomonas rapida]WAR43156.1 EAL domain-containing protein [Methylomonas rapida]